jgi:uncharacterized protein (DUF302 family)
VLASIYAGISRPDLAAAAHAWSVAPSYEEFRSVVGQAAGPAGLMEFLRLDQDAALRMVPGVRPFRLVRIIAGNPLTMTRMTRYVPQAGSYAPVTILVWEHDHLVRMAYDTMESLLTPYGDDRALTVARELDDEVLTLLRSAAGAK